MSECERERERGNEEKEKEKEKGERERGKERERESEGRMGEREGVSEAHMNSGWKRCISAQRAIPSLHDVERSVTFIP